LSSHAQLFLETEGSFAMSRTYLGYLGVVLIAVAALAFAGCSQGPPASPAPAASDATTKTDVTAVKMPEGFEKLSAADQTAALAQKVCPVSGEKLGEMGTPFKVTVKGRDVFLCCPNCKEDLEKDPDKYLAKLDAK
jgi:YHS domain-containing protein